MPSASDFSRTNSNSNTNIPPKSSRKRRSEVQSPEQQSNKSELTKEVILANIKEEDKTSNSPITCRNIKRRKEEGEKEIADDLKCEEEFNECDSPSQGIMLRNTGKETVSGKNNSSGDKVIGNFDDEDSPFSFVGSSHCYNIEYNVSPDVSSRNPNTVHPPEFYYYGNSHDVIDLMYKKSEVYPRAYVTGKPMSTEIIPRHRLAIFCWLMEVAYEEQQSRITYHLAVNFFDRVLSSAEIKPTVYQLVAGACLKLASKIEEVIPLSGENLVSKCNDAFTLKQLIKMETIVTHTLDFSMNPLTTLHFIDFYFRVISFTCDMQSCITPTNSESPLQRDNDDSSILTKKNSVDNSPISSPSSSQSHTSLSDGNKLSESTDYFLFSESPIVLQDELINYYISSAAMADFIILTSPYMCYDPSKLAAAILYAQFSDFDGYLNFSKYKREDIEEEYLYIKPFFEQIDRIVEEYKVKYDFLVEQAQKSLEGSNRNETTEDYKYRIQTSSYIYMELLNNPILKDHVEKYQNKLLYTSNNQE